MWNCQSYDNWTIASGVRAKYPARFSVTENYWFLVVFPDVPEALTNGCDFDDAKEAAADALKVALEWYDEQGMPRPQPSPEFPGAVMIEI